MKKAQSLVVIALVVLGACSSDSSGGQPATTQTMTPVMEVLPACGMKTKTCDPKNLGGMTCTSVGAGTGTLLCDPVTCSFDVSMCQASPSMGTGGLGSLFPRAGRSSQGTAGSRSSTAGTTSAVGGAAAAGQSGGQSIAGSGGAISAGSLAAGASGAAGVAGAGTTAGVGAAGNSATAGAGGAAAGAGATAGRAGGSAGASGASGGSSAAGAAGR